MVERGTQWDKHQDTQSSPDYKALSYEDFMKLNRKVRRDLMAERKRELKRQKEQPPVVIPNDPIA